MLTTYKHIVIQEYKGPPEFSETEAIEQELGVALPPSFRQFLEVSNGGSMEYSVRVPPTAEGDELMFCDLFYAGKDRNGEYGNGTLIGEVRSHRRFMNIPMEVLPFARDGGDSTVYLDLTEQGKGRVVAFVHGLPAWTGLRQEDALVEIASSFDDFISLLYLSEEYIEEAIDLLKEAVTQKNAAHIQANREFLDLAVPSWRDRYPHLA